MKREDALKAVLMRAKLAAARRVEGLFLDPSHPMYNADAAVPWKEASTRTRAALSLANASLAAERANPTQTVNNVLNMVAVVPRLRDAGEWEALHRGLSDGSATIDVAALPPKEPE